MSNLPCQCPDCKPRTSCSKSRKSKCPTCDHRTCRCKPVECTKEQPCPPEDALECCRCVELPRTVELPISLAAGPPVLMLNDGDDFSPKRTLQIEACVSVAATDDMGTFPVNAIFQIRVDGVLQGPIFTVNLAEATLETDDPCDARACFKVRVKVTAGVHGVELLAWTTGAMDLIARGECGPVTFLKVCTVADCC